MRFQIKLLLSLLIASAGVANATDVQHLNRATVPVADRSDAEYKRGIAKALSAVLVKQSGSTAVARSKAARGVVGQAHRLVQQFGYERARGGGLLLRVEFDARVLAEEMRARKLAMWGKERPDTLAWIVINDVQGRRLVHPVDDKSIVQAVKSRAQARGIPLKFPRGDSSETSALTNAADGSEISALAARLSEQYSADAHLVGYLNESVPSIWEAEWRLDGAGEARKWNQQGDIPELLAEEAIDNLADALGRRYASSSAQGEAQTVAVTIRGLLSADDYARTERYLQSLDSVSNLFVRRLDEDGIVFDLSVQGGLQGLSQSVSFGRTLVQDQTDASAFFLNPR